MTMVYDKSAKKKNTNLSINSDLLQKAKENNINLSSSLEKTLENELRKKEQEKWEQESKEAIEHYNKNVEKYGVFSDRMRNF